MRSINLLPENEGNTKNTLDATLCAEKVTAEKIETDALAIAHKVRSTRHLLEVAHKEGVDVSSFVERLRETKPELWILGVIISEINGDILKTLSEAGIEIPSTVQHELKNNRFVAFRGRVE